MRKYLFSVIVASLFFGLASAAVVDLVGPSTDADNIPVKNTGDAFSANELNLLVDLFRGFSKDDNGTFNDQTDDKVGIGGILNPAEALHVNGRVRANFFIGDGSLLTNLPVSSFWTQTGSDINYASGEVGIGVANPSARLHVAGDARLDGELRFQNGARLVENGLGYFTVFPSTTSDIAGVLFQGDSSDVSVRHGYIYGDKTGANDNFGILDGDTDWILRHEKDVATEFKINDSSIMTLLANGNVGIGTTAPTADLHLQDSSGSTVRVLNGAANNASRVTVGAHDYSSGPTWRGANLEYFGSGMTGTRFGLPEANLSALNFTNSANVLVGTNGNTPIVFGTSSLERMRVQGNGRVGIGTTTPAYQLDINDDAASGAGLRVTGGGSGQPIAVFSRDVGSTGSMVINASSGDPQFYLNNSVAGQIFSVGVDGTSFKISDNAAVGTNDRFVIDSTGEVGIGTASPVTPLHVANSVDPTSGEALMRIENTTTENWSQGEKSAGIEFAQAGDVNAYIKTIHTRAGTNHSYEDAGLVFATSPATNPTVPVDRLIIDSDGLVGIGTNTPAYDLDVAGDINLTGDLYKNGVLFSGGKWQNGATAGEIYYNGGNVGIGTLDPANKLHVAGTSFASSGLVFERTDAGFTGSDFTVGMSSLSGATGLAVRNVTNGNLDLLGIDDDGKVDIWGNTAIGANAAVGANQTLQVERNTSEDSTTYQIYSNTSATSPALTGDRTSFGTYFRVYNRKTENGSSDSDAVGHYGQVITDGTSTFRTNYGGSFEARNDSTAASGLGTLEGVRASAFQNGLSGTIPTAYGLRGRFYSDPTAGSTSSTTTAYGVYGHSDIYRGTVGTAYGIFGTVGTVNGYDGDVSVAHGARGYVSHDSDDGATLTTAYGGYFSTRKRSTATNITTAVGVYSNVDGATTAYGAQVYANDAVASNNYGVYIDASNASGTNAAIYVANGDIIFQDDTTIRTNAGEIRCPANQMMVGFNTGGIMCESIPQVYQ